MPMRTFATRLSARSRADGMQPRQARQAGILFGRRARLEEVNLAAFRFGIAGMSSDHVWAMADGLAAQPEVQLVYGGERYPELRQKATERWKLERTFDSAK